MNLQLVGCSHHRSNVAAREQLAFSAEQVQPFLQSFYKEFPKSEAVLLSTCNRTELYVAGGVPDLLPGTDELIELLTERRGIVDGDIKNDLFAHHGQKAVRHLFSVAASLDSMVLGEAQILSQVKQAYQLATDTQQKIPLSHQVFQAAIRVARRVTNETRIHANRVSIPSIAIGSFAKQIFERLDDKRMLVIGAGKMAEETLTYLREHGGRDILVLNRTHERAMDLASKFGGQVGEWQQLTSELIRADIVVSTTGATQPIVTADLFDDVVRQRQQRPVFILDLAIPRDFEQEVGDKLNVYLYSIDDLQKECDRNRTARRNEWPKANRIIDQETLRFMQNINHRNNGSTITQLKLQANETKEAELRRLMNRLEGVSDEHRKEIEYSFSRVVNKILHPPLESLKEEADLDSSGLLEALKRLFRLDE